MKKTIKIYVRGGCVCKVKGIPEGYKYLVIDDDILDEDALEID